MAGVAEPFDGRAIGHPQRAAGLQPGHRVHERIPVGFAAGIHAQTVDPHSVGGDRVCQLAEGDLDTGVAQCGQRQHQVGVASAVERPSARVMAGWVPSSVSCTRRSRTVSPLASKV